MEIDVANQLISFKTKVIYSLQTKLISWPLVHNTFVMEMLLFHSFIFETFMMLTIIWH
jgi:hypothetical protein